MAEKFFLHELNPESVWKLNDQKIAATGISDTAKLDAVVLDYDAKAGERTLDAVYEFLGRFVVYPTTHAQVAHTLWTVHTHLMSKWDSTPRIAFLSAEP